MDWKLGVVSLIKTTYRNYIYFHGDRTQKKLSAADQIKKLALNLATKYTALSNYSGSQTL